MAKRPLVLTALATAVVTSALTVGSLLAWQSSVGEDEPARLRTPVRPSEEPDWDAYFPTANSTTLLGKSTDEVERLLGAPLALVRQFDKEVWIYSPFEDDPTGMLVFFERGKLVQSRTDEFNGVRSNTTWQDEEFWFR